MTAENDICSHGKYVTTPMHNVGKKISVFFYVFELPKKTKLFDSPNKDHLLTEDCFFRLDRMRKREEIGFPLSSQKYGDHKTNFGVQILNTSS